MYTICVIKTPVKIQNSSTSLKVFSTVKQGNIGPTTLYYCEVHLKSLAVGKYYMRELLLTPLNLCLCCSLYLECPSFTWIIPAFIFQDLVRHHPFLKAMCLLGVPQAWPFPPSPSGKPKFFNSLSPCRTPTALRDPGQGGYFTPGLSLTRGQQGSGNTRMFYVDMWKFMFHQCGSACLTLEISPFYLEKIFFFFAF